jgi:hypothetical protein
MRCHVIDALVADVDNASVSETFQMLLARPQHAKPPLTGSADLLT